MILRVIDAVARIHYCGMGVTYHMKGNSVVKGLAGSIDRSAACPVCQAVSAPAGLDNP